MTINSMLRGGAMAVLLSGAILIQGCSSPDPTMTARGTRLLGTSGISTSALNAAPYSGADWDAALYGVMASDSSGE
jgi:hypothetical protein